MLISHKNKFITIDIPKTGTRSLRETFLLLNVLDIIGQPTDKSFYQHGTALDCEQGLRDMGLSFSNYFSFCVVRNPWERYLSFFKYYKEKAENYLNQNDYNHWTSQTLKQGKDCAKMFESGNYQQILKNIIINHPEQSHYYLDNNKTIMVSHIAEFSNIQQEFRDLCTAVGVNNVELQHKNKSTIQITCKEIYNQELIDMVVEKEQHVIKMYKYSI